MLFERRRKRRARPWNPLAENASAVDYSGYHRLIESELMRLHPDFVPASDDVADIHDDFRGVVLGEGYPCVGSRSAAKTQMYRLGVYDELGTERSALGLCHDIYEFCREFRQCDNRFVSMVACFRSPAISSEQHFEELLWNQLQRVHTLDQSYFGWDANVSNDPADPAFSFSIGGRAFFIVGLHPLASRRARRFPRPILVLNLREQFDRLRVRGKYETMKMRIRSRDESYSGSINPMVADHGTVSEARQYSGRKIPDNWKCPFHAGDQEEDGG